MTHVRVVAMTVALSWCDLHLPSGSVCLMSTASQISRSGKGGWVDLPEGVLRIFFFFFFNP